MTVPTATLRSAGTCLVVELPGAAAPRPALGRRPALTTAVAQLAVVVTGPVPHNALDEPWPLTVLPTAGDGWPGTPA